MSVLGRFIDERFGEPGRRMKASAFQELTVPPGAVVFLGDSITEGGAWHEWFPGLPVANRGIGGDRSAGVLARLDTAIQAPPSAVLLLIGTNDLTFRVPVEEIAGNVDAIIAGITAAAPGTRIVLQSVMPRHAKYRDRIHVLNDHYRAIAAARRVEYLDLWAALADHTGALRADYTLDGLHLGGAGYRAWISLLRDRLLDLGFTGARQLPGETAHQLPAAHAPVPHHNEGN